MTEHRNWRDAKIPQWVKDSILAESAAMELSAALSWPTEAKPKPLPFQWGEYDRVIGKPSPGRYWSISGPNYIVAFDLDLAANVEGDEKTNLTRWKTWAFRDLTRSSSPMWASTVILGPLFASERDARLYALWLECEASAHKLMNMKRKLSEVKE